MGMGIVSWKVLSEYGVNPLVIIFSGGFWFAIGIPLFVGIWQGHAWARICSILAATSYSLWYWGDRLFLQVPHANWPFVLIITIILLAFTVLTILANKQFFTLREIHD